MGDWRCVRHGEGGHLTFLLILEVKSIQRFPMNDAVNEGPHAVAFKVQRCTLTDVARPASCSAGRYRQGDGLLTSLAGKEGCGVSG